VTRGVGREAAGEARELPVTDHARRGIVVDEPSMVALTGPPGL